MDTFILAVSAAVLFILGYGVVWTVRAVRRVGIRRFARALGALVWACIAGQIKFVHARMPHMTLRNDETGKRAIAGVERWDDHADCRRMAQCIGH